MHQSIATLDHPEFINLQPLEINPLMAKCTIKVLYVGENRNKSFISKEVATEMSKTLRGAPIVGYYKDSKDDFADHGQRVTMDDEGVHFDCMTVPYGFVSPDAEVWFQKFNDLDDFGNAVEREYLMTTGYLWQGQFKELENAFASSELKPQSMELDESTLDGHWATNNKSGMDFFIINDAVFSKLCILGEDVEPCFEGASVNLEPINSKFSLDDSFKKTLYSMMEDLRKFTLKGGQQNMELEIEFEKKEEEVKASEEEKEKEEYACGESESKKDDEEKKEYACNESESKKDDEDKKEYAKVEEEKNYAKAEEDDPEKEDEEEDKKDYACNSDSEKEDDEKEKYTLLESQYTALKNDFDALQKECEELRQFKLEIDNSKKKELIDGFYMLNDEDKADVIENISKYTYDEIEAKLSVLCVRKKVSFDLETENTPKVTFNFENNSNNDVPAWIQAVRDTEKL